MQDIFWKLKTIPGIKDDLKERHLYSWIGRLKFIKMEYYPKQSECWMQSLLKFQQ